MVCLWLLMCGHQAGDVCLNLIQPRCIIISGIQDLHMEQPPPGRLQVVLFIQSANSCMSSRIGAAAIIVAASEKRWSCPLWLWPLGRNCQSAHSNLSSVMILPNAVAYVWFLPSHGVLSMAVARFLAILQPGIALSIFWRVRSSMQGRTVHSILASTFWCQDS